VERTLVFRFSGCVLAACVCLCAGPAQVAATVWNVSSVSGLNHAMHNLSPGDEVVLAPGYYDQRLGHGYYISVPNVTIRGATGDRDDVVLFGGGMNDPNGIHESLQFAASDITVKDLTISGFYHHGIHVQPGSHGAHIDNVKTLNIGQQHMKIGTSSVYTDNGIVENCLMEQTEPRTNHPILNYTGGVDALGARNWIIRDNVVMNIQGETGEGGGGIFFWQNVFNPTVERNVVIDCDRGIAMGNPGYQGPNNIVGGIVRNNFICHANEINLELIATTDLKVYNNTIYGESGSSYNRAVSMEGAITSGLEIFNNLIHGVIADRGLPYSSLNNITGSTPDASWFADVLAGDLHLTAAAVPAIDGAQALPEVLDDIDGQLRPFGDLPDIGADEYLPEPATMALVCVGAMSLLARKRR